MKTALTIAGSDSSGGAGIQADLKTFACNGVYGMSAVTGVTAQNTMGVFDILTVPPDFLKKQIDAVVTDIFPDAVKIGMISSSESIGIIFSSVKEFGLQNIVLDPVLVSTSGTALLETNSVLKLSELFPVSKIVTPNIPEAEVFSNIKIINKSDMERAGRIIFDKWGCAVLVKGGHGKFGSEVCDFLVCSEGDFWFSEERINNPNTHGTGCTLSSAICACLAKGMDLRQSVESARSYLINTMKGGLNLGKGRGPLLHNFMFQ